ncbi:MAG: 30S ribosomal protein S5 [Candidatus Doudnabacteria bacterium]|nr:30S ribosomal protein S5 [Candidatus Doudnabacteria bacterium]
MREVIKKDLQTKVVEIKRVTRVVAGGKRMRFRALVVAGDRKGRVGVGLKKGADVAEAVNKATNEAKKNLITVAISNETIPHAVKLKYKAALILLKPAPLGSGIIAGGPVRAVIDLAGIKNISSKMLGSNNKVSNVRATYEALKKLKHA